MAFTTTLDKQAQVAPAHLTAWKALRRPFQTTSSAKSKKASLAYRIAAAYSAKGDKIDPERNTFHLNAGSTQRPSGDVKQRPRRLSHERPSSGQDAFFASNVPASGAVALGVADGVGGWTDQGIDPADFSHTLCERMARLAETHKSDAQASPLKPTSLMDQAFQEVIRDAEVYGGGSTACVAVADSSGRLDVANLGDSGFAHIGLNAVRHHSSPQTRGFNTPFQLAKLPKRMLVQMAVFNGLIKKYSDTPQDATISRHVVKSGDVLVFATDGLWDNLTPQDTLRIVSREMASVGGWTDSDNGAKVGTTLPELTRDKGSPTTKHRTLQATLAQAILGEAKAASSDTQRDGPFAKQVQKRYPSENWRGGKVDDICVVVAVAVDEGQ